MCGRVPVESLFGSAGEAQGKRSRETVRLPRGSVRVVRSDGRPRAAVARSSTSRANFRYHQIRAVHREGLPQRTQAGARRLASISPPPIPPLCRCRLCMRRADESPSEAVSPARQPSAGAAGAHGRHWHFRRVRSHRQARFSGSRMRDAEALWLPWRQLLCAPRGWQVLFEG